MIIKDVMEMGVDELIEYIKATHESNKWTVADENNSLQRISELWEEAGRLITEPTIEQLKKQIKYSKNPMEVKMLNMQLNQMYKEQKGNYVKRK